MKYNSKSSLRNRKKLKRMASISRWHEDVYLDSESSYDYSQVSEDKEKDLVELNDSDFPLNKLATYQHETSI